MGSVHTYWKQIFCMKSYISVRKPKNAQKCGLRINKTPKQTWIRRGSLIHPNLMSTLETPEKHAKQQKNTTKQTKRLAQFKSQQLCYSLPHHQAWPGPRLSPEETHYWSAQPRKPAAIKAMTVELYSIDRQRRGHTILFIEESSILYSLMSDNWWQVGPCFLPWPWQAESQMDYI